MLESPKTPVFVLFHEYASVHFQLLYFRDPHYVSNRPTVTGDNGRTRTVLSLSLSEGKGFLHQQSVYRLKREMREGKEMRCCDCIHFKDRYVLYMDGEFPKLQELLDKGLISGKDFMCEGYGCIFQPCQDFTNKGEDQFMGIPFSDLQDGMEKQCENFEQRKKSERILVKNISFNAIRDKKNTMSTKNSQNDNNLVVEPERAHTNEKSLPWGALFHISAM